MKKGIAKVDKVQMMVMDEVSIAHANLFIPVRIWTRLWLIKWLYLLHSHNWTSWQSYLLSIPLSKFKLYFLFYYRPISCSLRTLWLLLRKSLVSFQRTDRFCSIQPHSPSAYISLWLEKSGIILNTFMLLLCSSVSFYICRFYIYTLCISSGKAPAEALWD